MSRTHRRLCRAALPALGLVAALFGGCSGESGGGPTDPDPTSGPAADQALVASKLATLAVTAATGPRGASFFDNFLPCPRRGVVDYRDANGGRQITVTGCDLGDGVTVDGTAELRWVGTAPDRATPGRLALTGRLTARVGPSAPLAVGQLGVDGIAFDPGTDPAGSSSRGSGWPVLAGLRVPALQATLGGQTRPVDDRAAPARVFGAGELTLASLPSPADGLAGLTEADLKRLAYHLGVALSGTLFNETLEYQRGPHAHDLGCGTVQVRQDTQRRVARLENEWRACSIGGGLFVDGTFTQAWADNVDFRTGPLSMVVAGAFTVGGGVPRTALTRLEWTVTSPPQLPGPGRIAGRLVATSGGRTFAFDLVLDD